MTESTNAAEKLPPPAILAPAGDREAFLAAVAAGADAVYCGLKQYSARMQARNFSLEELAALTRLAHERNVQVYVTLNTLLKPDDLNRAARLVDQLEHGVKPDALIVQDLGMAQIARQTGFSGELHLSTLTNVSFGAALDAVQHLKDCGVRRVVLPRELTIDEIRQVDQVCPEDFTLEVFIHGALCYGVSGRCYWSSYLGGKSGLRGRCVQPCRRQYKEGSSAERFFSCQDLSLDVLVKVLKTVPKVRTWKIEGRKKSAHYVYYTVSAYKLLRDQGHDPAMKKTALGFLEQALGRSGTHYHFLSQRPRNPVDTERQTGSGLLIGAVKGTRQKPFLSPRETLLPGDLLRIGYEDQAGHTTYRVTRAVPRNGQFSLSRASRRPLPKHAPVFLIDRREPELQEQLAELESALTHFDSPEISDSQFQVHLPRPCQSSPGSTDLQVTRLPRKKSSRQETGIWLSEESMDRATSSQMPANWWWLPPVVWPDEEDVWRDRITAVRNRGAHRFVLNMPWQITWFRDADALDLWAGPFCNIANPLALQTLLEMGFTGAVVSPELGQEDYLKLPAHSPLPLGIVLTGNWPLCITRSMTESVSPEKTFVSPRGEVGWMVQHGGDRWLYPNWPLDLTPFREPVVQAGYTLLIQLSEPFPAGVHAKNRPGLWNWRLDLS